MYNYNVSSNFRVSSFRKQPLVWMMLTVLCLSFAPSVSFAQQPSATISSLTGTVFVNGQQQGEGTVLLEKDIIRTEAGASVVLELSDGSQLELGENTRVEMQELTQTATGARTSLVKMLYGRVRAMLSAGHQQEGSSFNIETPNALVGVKFSQPDVEVQYNADTEETTAFAITVALLITNLLTGEEQLVPIGSTAIVTALGIQIISGLTGLGTTVAESTAVASTGGIGTGTIVAIGAGVLAAAGGIAALAVSSSSDDGDSSGSTTVREAEPSDFFGQYEAIDPSRSFEEYHNTVNFLSNMSMTFFECVQGVCRDGSGTWSFDKNSTTFSLRSNAGAEFSGPITGTTDNFTLTGRFSNGQPGTIIFTRK